MKSYRYLRRSFLAGLGGAFGLEILFRNLEASAQGQTSPPRLLIAQWPLGTVHYQFIPTGTGTSYVTSPILEPFETKGLRNEMIALHGLSMSGVASLGGGHEAGSVIMTTGADSPGCRQNGGEADDPVAGGPSWDQIFLKNVPALARRNSAGEIVGPGSVSASCEARVDSYETSTQVLSYAYTTRTTAGSRPTTADLTENVPILPELEPAKLYANLFAGFIPGGNMGAALKALKMRKSVLDSALRELARIHDLAPSAERPKIDLHTEAIRKIERQLSDQIAGGGGTTGTCENLSVPAYPTTGRTGLRNNFYSNPTATADESAVHAEIGTWHMSIIRAAFQCDLIRVATFQWAPGQNDTAFAGMVPSQPQTIYRHHPYSHRVGDSSLYTAPPPTTGTGLDLYQFLTNIHTWYNQKTANILADFKSAIDGFGNNLLDHTIVPFITEVGDAAHQRNSVAALIFGGRALGMQGGQFQRLANVPYNNLWATIAQAYFKTSDPLSVPELANEVFVRANVAPIPGLFTPPA